MQPTTNKTYNKSKEWKEIISEERTKYHEAKKQFITNDMYYKILINNEDLSKEWTEKLRILMTKNAQCKINIQTVKTKLLTTALNITRKNKWLFLE